MIRNQKGEGKTYSFYMSSGHVIHARNIKILKMDRSIQTGRFTGYEITWVEGKRPEFFSLVLDDIVAVTCLDLED